MKIKIFDCSISSERYKHNSGIGPRENDIISNLKKYANDYDCEFTSLDNCDVILTNDIFPSHILNIDKPKIKRMDGIFYLNHNIERNDNLNKSAEYSNHTIFISEYSKNTLHTLYPNIKLENETVILNSSDDSIFYNTNKSDKLIFSAISTNWNRSEKRFNSLIDFANEIEETIYLIGYTDKELPKNIINVGYINDYKKLNQILNQTTAHINLSYRDAAPKTVCHAIACGLPILYAESGGVSELVDSGVSIKDEKDMYFCDEIYNLNLNDIMLSYEKFKNNFSNLRKNSLGIKVNHQKTMKQYFDILKIKFS